MTQADELTTFQRERALETLTSQNPERACADVIEGRVADERRCPRCDMPGATQHGMANSLQRYRCDHCRRIFNDAILDAIDAEHLRALLSLCLGRIFLCTDGSKAFKAMAKDAGIPHHQAMHIKAGIRVKERIFHTQNVNA